MLIPSPRHTAADLALWAELEAADLAHYHTGEVAAKAIRAMDAVREFAAGGPCYASVSWGKDSVTLAHLVRTAAPHVRLCHLRGVPTANPDCAVVRRLFLTAFPGPYTEREVRYTAVDFEGVDERQRAGTRQWIEAIRGFGDRYLSGIRADESGGRRLRFRRHGVATANTCGPLGWWTAADVFAYLAHHRLPVHPVYAMLGGGRWQRDHVRTDELLGASGNQFGRREWEREYYGDVLRRLQAARPSGG